MKSQLFTGTFLSLLLTFESAHAQLVAGQGIGIDFNGSAATTGTNFNAFSEDTDDGETASLTSLIDLTGAGVSGVTFSLENQTGQNTERADFNTQGTGGTVTGPLSEMAVWDDGYISNNQGAAPLDNGGHFELSFTGLNDSMTYELTGGFDNNNANFDATWSANGQSFTTNPTGADGAGYGSLSGLTTDGSGNLVIQVERRTLHVTIGGLTLTAEVPDNSLNFPAAVPEAGYSFPNAFPGLSFGGRMASLDTLPSQPEKLFVTDGRGQIWMVPDVTATNPTRVSFLDRRDVATSDSSSAMNGIAFHPDFENNGYFYTVYLSRPEGWTRLSRFTVADPSNITTVDNSTEHVLIEANFTRNHGFNSPTFGPDGYLYFSVGDGSQHDDFGVPNERLTQTIDGGFWSAVHRIDVDKKPGNYEPQNITGSNQHDGFTLPTTNGLARYSIPADNPFLDQVAADGTGISTYFGKAADPNRVRTEMFGIGQRSPWKIGFVPDPITGEKTSSLWVADVMFGQKERYYILPKGGNAGWAYYSGTGDVERLQTEFDVPAVQGFQYVQPIVEYEVNDLFAFGGNKSIIGGDFYTSTNIPSLTGAYIMADFNRGAVWAVHRDDHTAFQLVDPVDTGQTDPQVGALFALDDVGITQSTINEVFDFGAYEAEVEFLGIEGGVTAMARGLATGDMYIADGSIVRRIEFNQGDFDSQLPQNLVATGAFTDVANFEVNPGMMPYDVNLTFWSDGALKTRFINMADTTEPIVFSEDDFWQFPTGTITMKHFEMDLDRDNPGTNVKRIETRFLVVTEDQDNFLALTYQWNDAGTNATLVSSTGTNVDLPITEGGVTTNQVWRIPSRAECIQCHTTDNEIMLGFDTRQLNHEGVLNGQSGNFLSLLESEGLLSNIGTDPANLPFYSQPSDESINIEERVQSYIAVNCAYCHYEGNNAVPSSWSGDHELTIDETSLLHGQVNGNSFSIPTDRLVIPGDTQASIILSRAAATNGYSRMPPLASNVIDQEGVDLLTEWINDFANAKPEFFSPSNTRSVTENSPIATPLGSSLTALDPDFPDAERGEVSYSIVSGNSDGFFDIDPATGQITISQPGLDFEEATSHQLLVRATDGFIANPREATTNVTINVDDLLNDDSQGDGIADEWAIDWFGISAINPADDSDGDGSVELLEYWANTNPTDAGEQGFILEPTGAIEEAGNEGFLFEWVIRTSLVIDSDYIVQGCDDLDFADIAPVTDFEILSTTPIDATVSRIEVKVPTTSDTYFLRLRSADSPN